MEGRLQIEPDEAFAAAIGKAEQALQKGEPELAARYYAAAAGLAMDTGQEPLAARVYGLAGELFRRADRPTDAVNCLQLALAMQEPGRARDLVRVTLAGVLTELGRFDAAHDLCVPVAGETRAAALDSLCSIALARGDRAGFDRALTELTAQGGGTGGWALELRGALRKRLDGELAVAWRALDGLLGRLVDAEPVARGAVWAELGETERLLGRDDAADSFVEARDCFEESGRHALMLRAEAGRVRTLLDQGVTPLHHRLHEGLSWADGHGMELLALDLERVLGRLLGDAVRLVAARDRALSWGLRPRAGLIELWRGELLSGADALPVLQEAASLLASDRPNNLLARVAHAEALAAIAPAAGRGAAEALVAEAAQLGMEGVQARLDALRR